MERKIKIIQYKKLDEAQKAYQSWRQALHLTEFEERVDFFEGFKRELIELEEEVKNEKKNRLNIAGEAADILLYAVGMLDQEGMPFSSLLANGDNVEFFKELQRITKKRIKDQNWQSSSQIFEKIKKDTDKIDHVIKDNGSDIKSSLKEIVLDSASLITLLGLPIGPIVSGKIARNEDKYKRELFTVESLRTDLALGQMGQSLQEVVRLRQQELKNNWSKDLDTKYLKASLGPMAGIYLYATAAIHKAGKMVKR